MKTKEVIETIFMELFELDREEVSALKKDQGPWDSVMHSEVVAELEEQFGIELPGKKILELDTFEKACEILKELGIDFD